MIRQIGWRMAKLAALFAVAVTLAGCAYAAQRPYRDDVRSVAMPIFENRSFYRGLEFQISEAVAKEIELRTPYKVASNEIADTQLQGTILAVEQQVSTRLRDAGGLPGEMSYHVLLNVQWKDLRSGEVLGHWRQVEVAGRYVPARAVGQTRQFAQQEVAQRAAQRITSLMRNPW